MNLHDLALYKAKYGGGGGPAIQVEPLSVTENGTTTAPSGKAYSPVTVNVEAPEPVLEPLTVTENGEYTPGLGMDGFSSVSVSVSGGGSVTVPAKAVNFRDYDGTITNSYSKEEFLALSAMPANPSNDGLTAQGWNWSFADARAYVTKYGRLEVGQMYITDDGKTRVYIHLEEGRTSPMLGVCPNGTVDVDWGDGTAHDTLTGTSTTTVQWTPNHAYAAPGDYVIKLTVTGSMGFYGVESSNQYAALLRNSSNVDTRNYVYRNAIKKVEIGSGVISINTCAFGCCYSLTSVTIPDSVTSIDYIAFYSCYNLASVTIPDSVTIIGNNAFQSCYIITSIIIPDSITDIGDRSFSACYSLTSVTIPDNVTNIGINAFYNCYSVAEYHLAPTTPPTLGTGVFTGISTDCIIYVPYSADHSILEAYKTASGWSTYASKIQEEPE